jgi:geranylgeranyl pyrophosphate synthase
MKNLNFEKTILSIHKEIQVKLKKTNKKIDNYIQSDVPLIPQLSSYFFNKRGKQLRPVLCLLSSKMINEGIFKINIRYKYGCSIRIYTCGNASS